ncbi:MAG: transposase [Nocardioidaceae bacterium]|nr:transposase [Nocardioidaceae bacterium]
MDLDATLVGAHSEKDGAAPTWKRGFGFHPLLAYLDATGEALAGCCGRATPDRAPRPITSSCSATRSPRSRSIRPRPRWSSGLIRRAGPTALSTPAETVTCGS